MSEANGTPKAPKAPKAADPTPAPDPEGATGSERWLGILGVVLGAVVLAVGLDLVTGGAVARAFGLGPVADDGG